MSIVFNGTTMSAVKFNGADMTKVIFNGTTVWTKSSTQTLSHSNSAYSMSWKRLTLGSGWTSAKISTSLPSSGIVFWGISTNASCTCAVSDAYNSVTGFVYGGKTVNGTVTGNSSGTISLSSGTTYYLYICCYAASTSSITCTVS